MFCFIIFAYVISENETRITNQFTFLDTKPIPIVIIGLKIN